MNNDRTPRRPTSARDKAEALFKAPAPVTSTPVSKRAVVPGAREVVTLRIDSEVLAHFQDGGPGWQDRINDVLRQAVPPADDKGLQPDELNASNDG
ncbi:MAG: BrnA antitoxin family protein [Afipia sp.]|nr:BrnA antitoxin family protein [Afipia sp.]